MSEASNEYNWYAVMARGNCLDFMSLTLLDFQWARSKEEAVGMMHEKIQECKEYDGFSFKVTAYPCPEGEPKYS